MNAAQKRFAELSDIIYMPTSTDVLKKERSDEIKRWARAPENTTAMNFFKNADHPSKKAHGRVDDKCFGRRADMKACGVLQKVLLEVAPQYFQKSSMSRMATTSPGSSNTWIYASIAGVVAVLALHHFSKGK